MRCKVAAGNVHKTLSYVQEPRGCRHGQLMAHVIQSGTAWREVEQVVCQDQLPDASLTLMSLTNRADDRSSHTGSRPVTGLIGSTAGTSLRRLRKRADNLLRVTPG